MSSKSMVLGYWDIRGVSGPSPAQPLGQRGAGGRAGVRGRWADLQPTYGVPRTVGRGIRYWKFPGVSEGAA